MENELITCPICGNDSDRADTIEVLRTSRMIRVCVSCYNAHAYTCPYCGDVHIRDGRYLPVAYVDGNREHHVHACIPCINYSLLRCNDCEAFFAEGTDDGYEHNGRVYCEACIQSVDHVNYPGVIRDYGYKPQPTFYPDKGFPFYFGIELEVAGVGDCNSDCMEQVADCFERGYVYGKSDCSIRDGFELVTEPATLDYVLRNKSRWMDAFSVFLDYGGISNDESTGLHIHVSRSRFTSNDMLARTVFLFDKFYSEICRVGQRDIDNGKSWASDVDEDHAHTCTNLNMYRDYLSRRNRSRYMAVNLCLASTVEFRIFGSTLKWEQFASCVQLVDVLLNAAQKYSDDEIMRMSFAQLCASDYTELKNRLRCLGFINAATNVA